MSLGTKPSTWSTRISSPHFCRGEASRLGVRELDPKNRLFAGIETFARSVDVVENELIEPSAVPGRFGEILTDYLAMLSGTAC